MVFADRVEAGGRLARALASYRGQDAVVYALPRGGVVVGAEVARVLGCPLDLVSVRKIGHPLSSEYAIAAVTEEGHTVTNPVEVEAVDQEWFRHEALAQQQEARRRRLLYLRGRPPIPATDKVAIVVDDGLATGLTMFAAVGELRKARPRKIVVAVPVAPPDTVRELKKSVDEVVALYMPEMFGAIGSFYLSFEQVSDAEVIQLMNSAVVVEQPR